MKTNHSKLSSLLFNTDDTKKCLWHFSSPSFMRDYKDICSSGICSSVVLWVRIPKRKNPRNTIWSKDDIPGMTWITFSIYGTHSMFNSPIVSTGKKAVYCLNYTKTQTMTLLSKHEKRDSKRLPNAANLSKSLILSLFLYFFTCFVTEDIPSPHGSSGYAECLCYFLVQGNKSTAFLVFEPFTGIYQ